MQSSSGSAKKAVESGADSFHMHLSVVSLRDDFRTHDEPPVGWISINLTNKK